jgi:hypothetical protein
MESPSGWLAVSSSFAPIHIGVMGTTKPAAQAAFREAVEAWAKLRELPDPSFPETGTRW